MAFKKLLIVVLALTVGKVQMVNVANLTQVNEPKDQKAPIDNKKQIKIAVVGDSETVGLCPGDLIQPWPEQLQAKLTALADKKYEVKNYSVSKNTILRPIDDNEKLIKNHQNQITTAQNNDLHKYSYWNSVSYQKVKEAKPDVIFMMLGLNAANLDYPSKFKRDYAAFVQTLQDIESKPELFIMIQPVFPGHMGFYGQFVNTTDNQLDLAKQHGLDNNHIIRVDQMVSLNQNKEKLTPEFGCDDIHLNQHTMDMLANQVLEKLQASKRVPLGKDVSLVTEKTCQQMYENQPVKIQECKKFPQSWQHLENHFP